MLSISIDINVQYNRTLEILMETNYSRPAGETLLERNLQQIISSTRPLEAIAASIILQYNIQKCLTMSY